MNKLPTPQLWPATVGGLALGNVGHACEISGILSRLKVQKSATGKTAGTSARLEAPRRLGCKEE
jgi:hypothetical protein